MLSAGIRLGPYEILSPLGAGGMGEVYRATDTRVDRPVALKVLPEEFFEDEDRRARFGREARTLASLNHPGIAILYSFEEISGRHVLAMELVEGEGLDTKIAAGPLPLEESLSYAKQIAEALEAAHEKGIVHRDLKPANVKVTPDGRVKLLDFGLAKILEGDGGSGSTPSVTHSPTLTARATAAGMILGTAAYMSPEQARGKPVDKRTDVWAFGCVLYEMLAGHRAFEGETVSDTLVAVLMKEPDWAALPEQTPAGVRRVLRKCLQRDAKLRLHDIADARLDLEELAGVGASGPLPLEERQAGPSPTMPSAKRPSRERGSRTSLWLAWGAAAAFATAAGALALRARAPELEPVETRPLTYSGHDRAPAASPDGRIVAFTSDRDGTAKIWLKEIGGGGEAALTTGPDDFARFAPDGSQVVFIRTAGNRQDAYRMAIVGGEPRKLVEDVTEADWAPEGSRIAALRRVSGGAGSTSSVLLLLAADGGVPREVTRVPGRQLLHPRWSADGRKIICSETGSGGAVKSFFVLDVETGKVRELPTGLTGLSSPAWVGETDRIVHSGSKSAVAAITAGAGRVTVRDVMGGAARTLFWTPVNADVLDILGAGRLVYDARSARENIGEVALAGASVAGGVRALTQGNSADRQPTYSPDGEWLLFSSTRSGNLDLWTISTRTGMVRRVTDDEAEDWDPAFSRDGKRIYWSSNRTGTFEIWTAATDGSAARAVTSAGLDAENPTETADGAWVVYSQGIGPSLGIWKIHPDGTAAQRIVSDLSVLPDASPDGRWVAYTVTIRMDLNQLRVASVADGSRTAFVAALPVRSGFAGNSVGRPRWAPDGKSLVFVGQDAKGAYGLFKQVFDPAHETSATRRPLYGFDPRAAAESFAISPDGKRLAVASWEQSFDVMVADRVPGIVPRPRSTK